jgi:hypothetical protein
LNPGFKIVKELRLYVGTGKFHDLVDYINLVDRSN